MSDMRRLINIVTEGVGTLREGRGPKVPDVLYHASPNRFDVTAIKPLSHFGTVRAAASRVTSVLIKLNWTTPTPFYVYPVRLRITNPLKIRDGAFNHSAVKLADMLYYTMRKKITDAERSYILVGADVSDDEGFRRVAEVLTGKGYDGFFYDNKHEDQGSMSWVILDPGQVSPAGEPTEMDTFTAYDALTNNKPLPGEGA